MQDLPRDIWDLVAAHLSRDELLGLLAVNRTFLNLALDEQYSKVDFFTVHERLERRRMVKSLLRLDNLDIARRVKQLCIRERLMLDLFRDKNGFVGPPPVVDIMSKISGLFASFASGPNIPDPEISLEGLETRPRDIVRLMARVVGNMANLRVLVLEWDDFSLYMDTLLLLESIKGVLGPSLYKLVLHTRISDLATLLDNVRLVGLEELELEFGADYTATSETITSLTPLIQNLSPTLRSLKISSLQRLNYSRLLETLGHFPNLRLLSIQLPFDKKCLPVPSCLNQMIRLHRFTLLHLELLPNDREEYADPQISTWPVFLEQCLLDLAQWPAALQSLTIPSTDLPTSISLIRPVATTLTSLRLVHRYLTYLEVADVVTLFNAQSSVLKDLSLGVTLCTPALLTLLARKLPKLCSLTLVIEDAPNSLHALLPNREKIDWNLVDISIFNKRYRDDSIFVDSPMAFEFEEGLMYEASRHLPSVRSFKGRGHMNSQGLLMPRPCSV